MLTFAKRWLRATREAVHYSRGARARHHRDVRTQIGQDAAAQRPGADALKFDHVQVIQGLHQATTLRAIKSFMISLVPP